MTEEIRTNTILNGRYLVQKELGKGGMGAVYLAQDMQNRRPVAIKVAHLGGQQARAQFQREADYLQKLHHHSLPRVWDYFSDTQRDFLVMEYIPGEDLETLVLRKGPQPEWLVLRWADELLDGLDYLHTQTPPIIHRDVKPNNLKPRQDETLVLVDFGIAKEYVPGMDTLPGASAVTPGYSPPEQYSNVVTDARSDLYSVGATMYFLLTGRHPPPAPDRASGDRKLLPPSQFIPDLSTGTEMVVRKALSLPRDERWASASEMRRVIGQSAQLLTAQKTPPKTGQIKLPPAPPAPPPGKPPAAGPARRPRSTLVLAGAVLVALLAVLSLMAAGGIFAPKQGAPEPEAAGLPQTVAAATATVQQPTATRAIVVTATDPAAAPSPGPPPASAGPAAARPVTSTVVPADEGLATSTPIPTRTPTPKAATPTALAARTSPAATRAEPTLPAAPVALSVGLISPSSGDTRSSDAVFDWAITGGGLGLDQAFEVAIWKEGEDPVRNGFGVAAATRDTRVEVDLAALDAIPGFPLDPGLYLWGVRLVQGGQPMRLVSESRALRYERLAPTPEPLEEPTDTPEPPP